MCSTASKAPIEIIREIVSHLHPENSKYGVLAKDDLQSCSLVHSKWRAASQPELFREAVYSFGRRGLDGKMNTLSDLTTFLQNNPHFSGWIYELRLQQHFVQGVDKGEKLNIGVLDELLQRLPNVRRLHLTDLPIERAPKLYHPPPYHLSLNELHISYTNAFRLNSVQQLDIVVVLLRFSSIQKLFLTCIPWQAVVDPQNVRALLGVATGPLVVPELGICGPDRKIERFHSILPRLLDLSSVRVLTFVSDTWRQHTRLLRQFSPSLEELYLPPTSWHDWLEHTRGVASFSCFSKLKKVAFSLTLAVDYDDIIRRAKLDESFAELANALYSAEIPDSRRYPHLDEIRVIVDPFTIFLDEASWRVDDIRDRWLENALESAAVANRTGKIVFEWWKQPWPMKFTHKELKDCMRRLFPRLHERGLMEFRGISAVWCPATKMRYDNYSSRFDID